MVPCFCLFAISLTFSIGVSSSDISSNIACFFISFFFSEIAFLTNFSAIILRSSSSFIFLSSFLFLAFSSLIFFAFNWNRIFAAWDIGSPFYISNVTKLAAAVPVAAYFLYRGLCLPLKRGVFISKLFPFRFLRIGIICLVLDLVKSYALLMPRFWARA
jgi:hypothetical protein